MFDYIFALILRLSYACTRLARTEASVAAARVQSFDGARCELPVRGAGGSEPKSRLLAGSGEDMSFGPGGRESFGRAEARPDLPIARPRTVTTGMVTLAEGKDS
jgi:hypothetical protein